MARAKKVQDLVCAGCKKELVQDERSGTLTHKATMFVACDPAACHAARDSDRLYAGGWARLLKA